MKIQNSIRAALALCFLMLLAGVPEANAATRHWTGLFSANWTDARNWSNNVPPVAGDRLVFPAGAQRLQSLNNFPSSTLFSNITVYASGYQFDGNSIRVGSIAFDPGQFGGLCVFKMDLVDGGFAVGAIQPPRSPSVRIRFDGTIYLGKTEFGNMHPFLFYDGGGTIEFTGPIIGKSDALGPSNMILDSGTLIFAETSSYFLPAGNTNAQLNVVPRDRGPDRVRIDGQFPDTRVSRHGGPTADWLYLEGTGSVGDVELSAFGNISVDGEIVGSHTVILAPGGDAVGRISTKTLSLTAMSLPYPYPRHLYMELDLNGPGLESDQVVVREATRALLDEGDTRHYAGESFGIILQPRLGALAPAYGQVFRVVDVLKPGALFSTLLSPDLPTDTYYYGDVLFQGIPYNGATFTTNGYSFQVRWDGGDGNDVDLTVVRTPTSNVATWDAGSAISANWNAVFNWVADAPPAAQDHLHFPPYVARERPSTNNYAAGRHYRSMLFTGGDYLLRGNSIALDGGITNTATAGPNTIDLPLSLTATQIFHSAYRPLRLTGALSGSSEVRLEGGSTVEYGGGEDNTYTGRTLVNHGLLYLNKDRAIGRPNVAVPGDLVIGKSGSPSASALLGNDGAFGPDTDLTIIYPGQFWLDRYSATVQSLTLQGGGIYTGGTLLLEGRCTNLPSSVSSVIDTTLNLRGLLQQFVVNNGGAEDDLVIHGVITNGSVNLSGGGHTVIVGSTVIINSPPPAKVHGGMRLTAGLLSFNGVQESGEMQVDGGILQGFGTVRSLTSFGGVISPGIGIGRLTVNGDLNLGTGATLYVELNGVNEGQTHDQLRVQNTANLTGGGLSGIVGYNAAPGSIFVIMRVMQSGPVNGTFAGLPEGASVTMSGQPFTISYTGGDGNDVTLTRTGSPAMFTGGAEFSGAGFTFRGMGDPEARYTVEASETLDAARWEVVDTFRASETGEFRWTDTSAGGYRQRFYRLVE